MDNVIGYCAVVCPNEEFWQGYFVLDTPELQHAAGEMKVLSLLTAAQAHPLGALQAAFVEGALAANSGAIGAASLALWKPDQRFFYILAERTIAGTTTSLNPLAAKSVDEARDLIEQLPEVLAIKEVIIDKLSVSEGRGRRKAFS